MDFTVLIVGLLIGIGIPLRNKAAREYRKKRGQRRQSSEADKGEKFTQSKARVMFGSAP